MANTALPKGKEILLSTNVISSTTYNVDFTDLDTDNYIYILRYVNIDISTDSYPVIRGSTNNGSSFLSSSSDYDYGYAYAYYSTSVIDYSGSGTFVRCGFTGGSGSEEEISGEVKIYSPADTEYTLVTTNAAGLQNSAYGCAGFFAGCIKTASAVNAISFRTQTGYMVDGEVNLYARPI